MAEVVHNRVAVSSDVSERLSMLDSRPLITYPVLQSMEVYLRSHYDKDIVKCLCELIRQGKIEDEGREVYEPDEATAQICTMRFYRCNRICALVDIDVFIMVKDQVDEWSEKHYIVSMELDMSESLPDAFDAHAFYFHASLKSPDRSGVWPLSEYLIPHLTKAKIEEYAEDLLFQHLPESSRNQKKNIAGQLANRLGLHIKYYKLYKYNATHSILFFRKGSLLILEKRGASEEETRRRVEIPENTIVINTAAVDSERAVIDIYHECIHYEWHFLFFRLQDMYSNDLRKIRRRSSIHYWRDDKKNPLAWLEWQARQGSMSLWMPRSFMEGQIDKIGKRSAAHAGIRWERIGRYIAEIYKIPKYRVRARMINLGHVEAKGALNYLGDHYIQPFAFDRNSCQDHETFFLTERQLYEVYYHNERLRELFATGQFVYVDGHVCVDHPQVVTHDSSGPLMTPWAKAHVNRCCLRFQEIYAQDDFYVYRLGRLNSDDTFNDHYFLYPGCDPNAQLSLKEKIQRLQDYIDTLPRLFPKVLTQLMADAKITEEELIRLTGLSESTVTRLRNSNRQNYKVELVISIIVALQLTPKVSACLLESAGINLSGNPEYMGYEYIVNVFYGRPQKEVQKVVAAAGLPPLKLTDDDE